MDVAVAVQADGSAQVREDFVALTPDPAGASFRRLVPVWKHDGVSMLNSPAQGPQPETTVVPYQVARGPALDLTWQISPGSQAQRVSVDYRAANVVAISGIRGMVLWSVLPAHRGWDASAVTIRVDLPDSAVLLQDPWVEESGWTVNRLPHGMTATRAHVPAAESATVGIEFTIDGMAPSKPKWQADQELADEFIPAFISAALFILVIGAGVLVLLRVKHPVSRGAHPAPAGSAPAVRQEPEDDGMLVLTPTARAALLRGRARGDRAAIAALVNAGLADRDRVSVARDLRRAAVAIVVFGAAVWIATALAVTQFGTWPLVVPGSIIVVGLVFAIAGFRYGVLTDQGARARMLYFARLRDGRASE